MDLQAIWTALCEGKGSNPDTNKILHRYVKGEEPPEPCPDYTGNTDAALSLLTRDSEFGLNVQIYHDLSEPVCPTVYVKHWAAGPHSNVPFDNELGSYRVDGNTLPITICKAAVLYHHEQPKILAHIAAQRKERDLQPPRSEEEIARHKRGVSEWFRPRAEFIYEVKVHPSSTFHDVLAACDWCYDNTPSCTTAVRRKERLLEALRHIEDCGFVIDATTRHADLTFRFIDEDDARRFLDKWGEGQVQKVSVSSGTRSR